MRAEEERLLAERDQRVDEAKLVALLSVVALGLLAILLLWLLRILGAREAARIQAGEARLATTLSSVGDAVIATDEVGRIERMNPVAEHLTGWRAGEAAGRPMQAVFNIVNEHTRQPVESPLDKVLREGTVVGLANHTILIARDGTERPIEDSGAPIRGPDGKMGGVVLVFRDATERQAAQRALAESEALFRGTFENAAIGMAHVGLDGRFLRVNEKLLHITGFERGALEARTFEDITHPDDVESDWAQARALVRGEIDHYTMQKRYIRADGSLIWVNLTVGLQRTGRGDPAFFISCIEDISERHVIAEALKQRSEELRESEERFRTLADNIPTLCWMADEKGSIFWYNARWYEYTGTTPEEMVGWGWQSVHDPAVLPSVMERWTQSLASGKAFEMVFPLRAADGTFRDFLTRIAPVRDEAGRIVRWFGVNTDIYEQRQAEAALKEADRRKDEFLAMLAHELRNPLAPIRNAVKLLRPDAPSSTQARAREMIERQSAHMTALLDDLLDVSRITRGQIELRREVLDLRHIIEHVIAADRPLLERLHHRLEVRLPEEPLLIDGDSTRLHQVIDNLVQNAAKYTDPGGRIEIDARRQEDLIILTVTDSGIGIAPDALAQVFELFTQVHAVERGRSGLGIGLSVVNRLVQMHGGTVTAHSAGPGQGSSFRVTLPTSRRALEPARSATPERMVSLYRNRPRLLLVDDQVDILESMALLMRSHGYAVHTADDGVSAIQVAESLCPDVMVIDIGMPRMDGYQVARWVRLQPWGQRARLIAATGWGQDEDRRRTREAGFDEHLVKPVDFDVLLRIIDEMSSGAGASEAPAG
jgi:PAS domain S-box-containing protein